MQHYIQQLKHTKSYKKQTNSIKTQIKLDTTNTIKRKQKQTQYGQNKQQNINH